MNISERNMPNYEANTERDIFAHWAWAIPVLLIVAAISLRQIDLYAPTSDEFFSMYNAGWSVNGPYSPGEIMSSLAKNSPAHMPGYFLLLSAWGNLTAFDAALGRVLTIYCALLALSINYRVISDFSSSVAGFFAIVLLASNAFFNFYIPHVRMYPLMFFLAGAVLWLYLRIIYHVQRPSRTDYGVLLFAVFALANTHVFSAVFFITLGVYHLIFVPKNRAWWRISFAVILAIILVLPYILTVIPGGMNRASERWGHQAADGENAIRVWLTLFYNGQPMLMLFSLVGVVLGYRKKLIVLKPYFCLVFIYMLVLGLFSQFTPFVANSGMRHQLPSWLVIALPVALGLLSLYRYHKWLAMILLLWMAAVAGLTFQSTADWRFYLAGRVNAFDEPPWHVISRTLARTNSRGPVIGIRLPLDRIIHPKLIGYSQLEHYFDRANIDLRETNDLAALYEIISNIATTVPEYWTIYQIHDFKKNHVSTIQTIAAEWQYAACETLKLGKDTVLERYRWKTLGCEPNPQSIESGNSLIEYNFYAARLDATGSRLFFVDEWTAVSDDIMDSYNMSFQLITQIWDNVAQLDLPMVHEDMLRHFSIDLAEVPRGSYRLMAIVYDKRTGKRLAWSDSGANPTELLPLAVIELE